MYRGQIFRVRGSGRTPDRRRACKENGAKVVQEPETKFYGDRSGTFEDPWGYQKTVMTHVEDVSPEEMGKRRLRTLVGVPKG